MDKKYLLKINYDEITKDNFDFVRCVLEDKLDGKICERSPGNGGDFYKFENGKTYRNAMILDFLTEILKPQDFDEWFDQQALPLLETTKTQHERTWKSGIENDHLAIKQALDSAKKEYFDNHYNGDDAYRIQVEHVWNSIVAILNLDQEPTDDNN